MSITSDDNEEYQPPSVGLEEGQGRDLDIDFEEGDGRAFRRKLG